MGSLDFPLCSICQPPRRHAGMDGHRYDVSSATKSEAGPVAEPITAKAVADKIAAALPPSEAKKFTAVVDRIAHRQKQVREAVARHRAKAKKAKAVTTGSQA